MTRRCISEEWSFSLRKSRHYAFILVAEGQVANFTRVNFHKRTWAYFVSDKKHDEHRAPQIQRFGLKSLSS